MNPVLKIASLVRATALPHLINRAALSPASLHQQIRSAGHAKWQNIVKTERLGDLAKRRGISRSFSTVTPIVDLAFKKIFGVEENKDLLIALINATVEEGDRVTDIDLLNPYNQRSSIEDKLSILDIKAKGENGHMFNVEIQVVNEPDYDKRALYYWSKLYAEQLGVSKVYSTLNKTIGIHILNFIEIHESEKYHNVFLIKEKYSNITFFKDLELHTIELAKFSKDSNEDIKSLSKKVKSELDIWALFFTRPDSLDKVKLPQPLADKNLKKALHVLETINFTEEERESYEARLKWMRSEAGALEKARQEAKLEIAQSMIKEGYALDDIIRLTGLSRSAVQNLLEA